MGIRLVCTHIKTWRDNKLQKNCCYKNNLLVTEFVKYTVLVKLL